MSFRFCDDYWNMIKWLKKQCWLHNTQIHIKSVQNCFIKTKRWQVKIQCWWIWFYFLILMFFFLCEHELYNLFVLKWWNDVMTPRCFCLLKRFFILGFGFRIFFSFNSLIVSIVFPHGPTSGWCQIDVWNKSNQIKCHWSNSFIKIKNFIELINKKNVSYN